MLDPNWYDHPKLNKRSVETVQLSFRASLLRLCTAVACTKLFNMTSRRSQFQEDTYFRVLRLLQVNPDMTQREIAERLGVSTSGMNYCLNALIDKGWVKVQNFSQSKNKFGYIYVLTPQGIMEKVALTGRFLKRKQLEYEVLRAEIESLGEEASDGDGASSLGVKGS